MILFLAHFLLKRNKYSKPNIFSSELGLNDHCMEGRLKLRYRTQIFFTLFSRFPVSSVTKSLGRSVDKYLNPTQLLRVLRSVVQLLVLCVVQYLETSVRTNNNRCQLSSQNKSATLNPSR